MDLFVGFSQSVGPNKFVFQILLFMCPHLRLLPSPSIYSLAIICLFSLNVMCLCISGPLISLFVNLFMSFFVWFGLACCFLFLFPLFFCLFFSLLFLHISSCSFSVGVGAVPKRQATQSHGFSRQSSSDDKWGKFLKDQTCPMPRSPSWLFSFRARLPNF